MKAKNKMKNLLFIILIGLAVYSCKEIQSTYKDFIEEEVTYPAKIVNLTSRGGKNRVQLSWDPFDDPRVSDIVIYWNGKRDSLKVGIQGTPMEQKKEINVEDLSQGLYTFTAVSIDKFGNSSVETNALGRAYGNSYQNSLYNRVISSIDRDSVTQTVRITFGEPSSGDYIYTILGYTNDEGNLRERKIGFDINEVEVGPLSGQSVLTSQSFYMPEPTAIDTFYTEMDTLYIN